MYSYGVLKASPKKLNITASKAGIHGHMTVTAPGKEYDVSIYLGSDRDPVYYSLFTSTDRAAIGYLLPLFEARFRLEWFDNFNRLQNKSITGALDFMRNTFLYQHIIQPFNLTRSVPATYPYNDKFEDELFMDNEAVSRKYGSLATVLRTMAYLYPNRHVVIFGDLLPLKNQNGTNKMINKMINIGFNQFINKQGILNNPYADGAIFFWDPLLNQVDGVFIMKESQYTDFIVNLQNNKVIY